MTNKGNETSQAKAHSPLQTLLFLLGLGVLCAWLMLIFPENGIRINDKLNLVFLTPEEVLPSLDTVQHAAPIEDIEEFLESYTAEVDSTAIKDSLELAAQLRRQALLKLQYPDSIPFPLENFFSELMALEKDKSLQVRAFHYGDSQIEGDRITGYLRTQWQTEFGGYGPGLLP